jgi:micrococcal nuclease
MLGFRRRSPVRSLVVVLAFAISACGVGDDASAPVAAGRTTATVERVSDGDTVRLVGMGRVRLIGVDTPEVYGEQECFGRQASAFVKRLLPPGSTVSYRLGVEPRDRYGRPLAYMWLRDGRMLNLLLVERGYATPLTIPPNVDYAERFVAAARRARTAARGLWRACGG